MHPLGSQLTVSHCRLLFRLNNNEEVKYYIDQVINKSLSKRELELINKLNMFLTITLTFVSILVEKQDRNFYSNLILERACSLKNK